MGKRDDDHKPGSKSPLELVWQQRRPHLRTRSLAKRLFFGLVGVVTLYYFFKYMPTDLKPPRSRPHYDRSGVRGPQQKPVPTISPKTPQNEVAEGPQHYFNGPIKFYNLAATLHQISKTKGSQLINQNVLFAASNLKSAATILPIACEMGMRQRNYVHFALMGRDDISMDILTAVNGISKDCKIMFHDGRPDLSVESSDFRMEVSCSAGLNHINTFMHPQAILVDGTPGAEDQFFLNGFRSRAQGLGRTLIELPPNAEQNLMWITRLDSAALSAWTKVTVDILVHAPPTSSGSLMRLLDSLKRADYFSSTPPRLTIELPHVVEEPTRRYLERFRWPPVGDQNSGSLLTLHHRIPQHDLTEEENSIRFLEAFWPSNPETSHVLVLSPQAEISPHFFHYLKYTLLEYRYSSKSEMDGNFMGISLDLPISYLNDSAEFVAPLDYKGDEPVAFLWQAPNSNAALYFGEKWVELHDFVAHSLSSQRALPPAVVLKEKVVSKTFPSWLEHVLRLARARGYWTVYPNFGSSNSFATLHNELYQPPEEYLKDEEMNHPQDSIELTADPAHHISLKKSERPLISTSLLNILPNSGELPKIAAMPLLSWDGEIIDASQIGVQAVTYSRLFRAEIGGCDTASPEKPRVGLTAGDLFCVFDEKVDAERPVTKVEVLPVAPEADVKNIVSPVEGA
ncbi:hypothetical protein B7494_g7473 [Chlorociboria aeruginascens]|nr:hypothetical protein B7494_g7473 [Chlorociboria aeruginascens]